MDQVSGRHLRASLETRKSQGKRLPVVLEVCKAPALPRCEHCDAELVDAIRVSRRFCSSTCRKAAGRWHPELEARLEALIPHAMSR